ncbi:hypothetical protein [Streptomyces sp. NPDC127033]|uniref:hypothetical protein n=1 Tax=Streptomyces sp. NPDC127033 TaxID=3347110 RepID=UPI003665361B
MNGATIVNPKHTLPEEVIKELDFSHQEELDTLHHQMELAKAAQPDEEAQTHSADLLRSVARASGVDLDEYRARASEYGARQVRKLEEAAEGHARIDRHLRPLDLEPAVPRAADPDFWFANAQASSTQPYTGRFLADGLHFTGKLTYNGGSLSFRNFGARFRYELQSNRIPATSTGRWRSDPHMELFGGLLGWVGPADLFSGDRWSKCWMIRRQTLFQFVFAPPGVDNRHILGERVEAQNLIFLESGGLGGSRMRAVNLPGFQPMPSLTISSPFPGQSIWAEVEVRFDIQVEGKSLLWIDPGDCLLRAFQWPLVGNA